MTMREEALAAKHLRPPRKRHISWGAITGDNARNKDILAVGPSILIRYHPFRLDERAY